MDNALCNCLVHQTAGSLRLGECLGTIALGHGVADATSCGLELGLDSTIAHARLFICDDALLLTLDVCHSKFLRSYYLCFQTKPVNLSIVGFLLSPGVFPTRHNLHKDGVFPHERLNLVASSKKFRIE